MDLGSFPVAVISLFIILITSCFGFGSIETLSHQDSYIRFSVICRVDTVVPNKEFKSIKSQRKR